MTDSSPSIAPVLPTTRPGVAPTADGDSRLPVIDSAALLAGGREVLISHGGECYRLRHTRNDKLILTK